MKTVIKKSNTVSINHLTDNDIIGIKFPNGEKAQVIKLNHESYTTAIPGQDNRYYRLKIYDSIQDVCKKQEAYIFHNKKEFLDWLWLQSNNKL